MFVMVNVLYQILQLRKGKMEELKIPLSDQEEAILQLMTQVHRLTNENERLKEEINRLKWSMTEHD